MASSHVVSTAAPPPSRVRGEALPDWRILARVGRGVSAPDPLYLAERAEQVFNALAASVPAFAGMSYRGLGDTGRMVTS